jgi:hypothetical protein
MVTGVMAEADLIFSFVTGTVVKLSLRDNLIIVNMIASSNK